MEGALRNSGTMPTILEKGNGMEIEGGSEAAAVNGSLKLGPWIHAPKRGRRRLNKENLTEERQPRKTTRASHGKYAANTGTSISGVLTNLGEQEVGWRMEIFELNQPYKDPVSRGEDSRRLNTGVKHMRGRKGLT